MKKVLITMLIAGSIIALPVVAKAYFRSNTLDTIDKYKVFDMDFNDNEMTNSVNNRKYTPVNNKGGLVAGLKGKAFEPKTGYLRIPKEHMNIGESEYVTVSFKYRYGGGDGIQMLCAFGGYDLYLVNGYLGFNTGNGDLYGIKYVPPTNRYIDITAVFHKSDKTKNKLYIDGVKQNIVDAFGKETYPSSLNQDFYIANWQHPDNPVYGIEDNSIIDEVKVYKTNITDKEASDLSKSISIPELSIDNNSKNPVLNWATEILPENLIYNIDFEDPNNLPDFNYQPNKVGDITGGQKVDSNEYYNGYKSAYIPNTMNAMGNHYNYPSTQSNRNIMHFGSLKLPSGTQLSLSYRVKNKTNGTTLYEYWGSGGFAEKLITLKPKIVETSPAGSNVIKVDSIEGLRLGTHLSSERTDAYGEYLPQIREIITNSDGTYTLRMGYGFKNEQIRGDSLRTREWINPIVFPIKTTTNTEWTLINANTEVKYNPYYDSGKRGVNVYLNTENRADANIDDIKFGYATKVKLYRDSTKIYEGYGSELNDTSSTDKARPNSVGNVTAEVTPTDANKKVKFKFNPATDNGTTYNYNITAVDKNGAETPKSKTQSVEVKSGIKGYSYVINKNANTEPSNTVNTTSTELEYTIPNNEYGDYYLHIKAIDNNGNVSNTIHHKLEIPKLTAVPKHNENMIRLDWTNVKESTYKVYQKKPGDNLFQSISTTDMGSGGNVKALLVYPDTSCSLGDMPTTTYIDKNGDEITIPVSASLKKWMEAPNSENPNGYGKGIINVDLANLKDYNKNPEVLIRNNNGEYVYDVIVFGIADCNGSQGITELAEIETSKFIEAGRGVLFGHDTVYDDQLRIRYLNLAKKYMGLNIIRPTTDYRGTEVKIRKKGLLTNYPWEIGDVGSILTTPLSHTSLQVPSNINDNWLSYANKEDSLSNFYLTTKNNMAMIQTGHSNGQATPDEQKILANTLFYLNQLSTDNFLNDYSGQDVTAPNKPSVLNHSIGEDFININLNKTEDNGSDYQYYVEATDVSNNNVTSSNTASATIKTGFKGYSYVVDTKENTIPDNKIETSETNINFKISNNQMYLHIKAIDNAGNESETLHFKIEDLVKPTLQFEINPKGFTQNNVLINVTANDIGSGVKEIVLPNGEVIKGTKATFTATQNGVYTFIAIDKMNNKTTQSITISNIDREKPTVTINNNKNWTNQNVQITINSND